MYYNIFKAAYHFLHPDSGRIHEIFPLNLRGNQPNMTKIEKKLSREFWVNKTQRSFE